MVKIVIKHKLHLMKKHKRCRDDMKFIKTKQRGVGLRLRIIEKPGRRWRDEVRESTSSSETEPVQLISLNKRWTFRPSKVPVRHLKLPNVVHNKEVVLELNYLVRLRTLVFRLQASSTSVCHLSYM